mmetsp:Transcript_1925/g.7127  ORF Transcript_1925/g.7127 Transcript_1925/m.7127 type:complete len:232 (+) Transcript_1925:591-1286(+)
MQLVHRWRYRGHLHLGRHLSIAGQEQFARQNHLCSPRSTMRGCTHPSVLLCRRGWTLRCHGIQRWHRQAVGQSWTKLGHVQGPHRSTGMHCIPSLWPSLGHDQLRSDPAPVGCGDRGGTAPARRTFPRRVRPGLPMRWILVREREIGCRGMGVGPAHRKTYPYSHRTHQTDPGRGRGGGRIHRGHRRRRPHLQAVGPAAETMHLHPSCPFLPHLCGLLRDQARRDPANCIL